MNIAQVEEKVKALVSNPDQAEFLFNLLECYGKPKASITRLKMVGKGSYNLAKKPDEVLWKKQVYFKATDSDQLLSVIDEMKHAEVVTKHQPRFIIALNSTHLLAIDTKIGDTLDIPLAELNKKFDFFLPWAGLEKAQAQGENPADVKAAEKMAKLFDLLRDNNPVTTSEEIHAQNVFLSRILFCYFAEDTGIFKPSLFTNHVASHTAVDGADLSNYLSRVFDVMNQEHRKDLPDYLTDFPYVNGGLFADKLPIPTFNRKSRAMLIECGSDLNWSEINPDIFGSMIQAVVAPSLRGNMGMHYTSVPNIMKVIEPLFLNELKEEFEKHIDNKTKLEQLLLKLEHIKIFDPACGSGNFLIIAYNELRQLEMDIFKQLQEVSKEGLIPLSRIKLSQFYGIELDDFAHEVAILSLWLAEHQMNLKFKDKFGHCSPALPLKHSGKIICENATRVNWNSVCPHEENSEIYILGNPPYLGYSRQDDKQKQDMDYVFQGVENYRSLDYIACWFYKAIQFISEINVKIAFVSTNSICQGEQVALLWPLLFQHGAHINFCHTSFKWENRAKHNAAVTCVIVGLGKDTSNKKKIISENFQREVDNINPYLLPTKKNVILPKRKHPICDVPAMNRGSSPVDGGFLLLNSLEKETLLNTAPQAMKFIKPILGAKEFADGLERWCIWIVNEDLEEAISIPMINERLKEVAKFRINSTKKATQALAEIPYRFGEVRFRNENFILIPRHGSDKREYLPLGFIPAGVVISDAAQAIYTQDVTLFGILSSRMHLAWIKTSCGKIKEDPRYSPHLGYNNFPFPSLTKVSKDRITTSAMSLIAERENYAHMTISEMYDPKKMPASLRSIHEQLDEAIEWAYIGRKFGSDFDRLEHLFKLYERITGTQNV